MHPWVAAGCRLAISYGTVGATTAETERWGPTPNGTNTTGGGRPGRARPEIGQPRDAVAEYGRPGGRETAGVGAAPVGSLSPVCG